MLVLALDDGSELRYHDAKDMGKVYLTTDLAQVPTLSELGPDALDPELTIEVFPGLGGGRFLRRARRAKLDPAPDAWAWGSDFNGDGNRDLAWIDALINRHGPSEEDIRDADAWDRRLDVAQ